MIHAAISQSDPFARQIEEQTGYPPRFIGMLPIAHAIQIGEADRGMAGLVMRTPAQELAFVRVTYSERLYLRFDLFPADLAACGMEKLGLLNTKEIPRAFRRSVRRIPAARVTAGIFRPEH
ncbi:hypothetical protein ACEUZ9_001351 [Paracoccus litorisediminis]|uniref:hypothetical protein n=1 Tax=Paracoccus litorisediminis TaxID=2006130 RepID=UPI00372E6EE7